MATNIDKLVILLSRGIAQRKLYSDNHPRMRSCSREFARYLQQFLATQGQDSVFVGVVDGKLVFEGRYLVGPSIAGGPLVKLATNLHCGGFSFGKRTTEEEIQELFSLAAGLKNPTKDLAEARELLTAQGITHVEVATRYSKNAGIAVEEDQEAWQGKETGGQELPSPILVFQALFDVVSDAHGHAALGHTLDIDGARSVSEHLLRNTRASFTDIMQLMHYPDFDSYTVGHSVRVATLAVFVGDRLGLESEELLALGTSALLHDVGKSQIPDEILFKPGRLDADEYRTMKTHAALGAEILMEHKNTTPMDIAAAWGHHIRHDGGGYPERPRWAIRNPVTALLQVCDVFEALTSVRPYKPPSSPRTAYAIMLKDEGAFEPALLTAFIQALGIYPPGNQVRLSDGSFGTVVSAGSAIDRPRVQITHDTAANCVAEADRQVIDLSAGDASELSVSDLILEPESVMS